MDDDPESLMSASGQSSPADRTEGILSFAPLDSPSTSTFLRTAETLEGLAKQLENLKDAGEEISDRRCTCGSMLGEREVLEAKLKLSGGLYPSFVFV